MKKFDYETDVLHSAEDDIRSNLNEYLEHFNADDLKDIEKEDLKKYLSERLLTDGVYGIEDFETGDPVYEATISMYFEGNEELIAEVLRESGNDFQLGSDEIKEYYASYIEHEVYKYEVDKVADTAIDNVLNGVETERPHINDILRDDYGFTGDDILADYYREEIQNDIQEYIEQNIDKLLEEVEQTCYDRYSYERSDDLQLLLSEKIMSNNIPLTKMAETDVLQDFKEVLGNEYFRDSGYTLADYFDNKEANDYVKSQYAMTVALEELGEAIEKANENIILPAFEQKEAENEIEME